MSPDRALAGRSDSGDRNDRGGQGLHRALARRCGDQYLVRGVQGRLLGGRGGPHLPRRLCRARGGCARGVVGVVTQLDVVVKNEEGRGAACCAPSCFLDTRIRSAAASFAPCPCRFPSIPNTTRPPSGFWRLAPLRLP